MSPQAVAGAKLAMNGTPTALRRWVASRPRRAGGAMYCDEEKRGEVLKSAALGLDDEAVGHVTAGGL